MRILAISQLPKPNDKKTHSCIVAAHTCTTYAANRMYSKYYISCIVSCLFIYTVWSKLHERERERERRERERERERREREEREREREREREHGMCMYYRNHTRDYMLS